MKYRLTGISSPYGGVSWEKATSPTDRFKYLFLFLESKRILVNPIEMEIKDQCLRSVLEIRQALVEVTKDVDFPDADIGDVRQMINACNAYLDDVEPMNLTGVIYKKGGNWADMAFDAAMKKFRNVFRNVIAEIGKRHRIKFAKEIPANW
jgi:hypothetical protein